MLTRPPLLRVQASTASRLLLRSKAPDAEEQREAAFRRTSSTLFIPNRSGRLRGLSLSREIATPVPVRKPGFGGALGLGDLEVGPTMDPDESYTTE